MDVGGSPGGVLALTAFGDVVAQIIVEGIADGVRPGALLRRAEVLTLLGLPPCACCGQRVLVGQHLHAVGVGLVVGHAERRLEVSGLDVAPGAPDPPRSPRR